MAISHAIIAAIVAVYGDKFDTHKSAGNAAVFFVSHMILAGNRAAANGYISDLLDICQLCLHLGSFSLGCIL